MDARDVHEHEDAEDLKTVDVPKRYLRVNIALYDMDNNQVASPGDELEDGLLDDSTVGWLLGDGLAVWVEEK